MKDLTKARLLVTPTSFGKSDPDIKRELESAVASVDYNTGGRPLKSGQLAERLAACDGYIAGLDEIDRTALAGAVRLKVIARYGVGLDNIDLEAAREMGMVVTNTPGANAGAVAELAVGMMVSLGRGIPQASRTLQLGEWPRRMGRSLEGALVGLLGFGAVGRQAAARLKGFGCRVLAFDPAADAQAAERLDVELADQQKVMSESDFLSLHLPASPETAGMVDADFLAGMKKGAYLINTSRGDLVDESALHAAIQSGQIAGAGLDVFQEEPPRKDHPLLALPQVLATPHMAAHSDAATRAMGRMAVRDCLAVLRGEEPENKVV